MRTINLYATAALFFSCSAFPILPTYESWARQRGTGGWKNITCKDLPNALDEGAKQWAASKAEGAWTDAVAEWKMNPPDNAAFPTWLSTYFDGPLGFACEKTGTSDECHTSINCGSGFQENALVNSPAGYIILESMRMVRGKFDSYYWGLYNAHQMMDAELDLFTLAFSPQIDPMKDAKVAMDIVGMVFAIVNASVFNLVISRLIPAIGATVKDTIAAIVNGALQVAKDSMTAINMIAKAAEMKKYLKDAVKAMIDNWVEQTRRIFTDPEQIHQLITNGSFWDPGNATSPEDVIPTLQHTLYAYMIPHAWAASNTMKVPIFIANSNLVPKRKSQSGCHAYDPTLLDKEAFGGLWDESFIFVEKERKVLGQSFLCDGEDAYWMVGLDMNDDPNMPPGFIMNPPGWDKFDGKEWGGLTREEIAQSAIDTWKFNGRRNGQFYPELSDVMDMDSGRKIPRGFVNIPVCSWMEAAHNYKQLQTHGDKVREGNPNFPCDPTTF